MLKFKFLLWVITKLLQRAVKNKPACSQYIRGKDLVFQIQTRDGTGRAFTVRNGKITSSAELSASPKFTMTFIDAAKGFAILSAKDSKEAFLAGLHTGALSISGDFVEVMWFQGLTDYLKPDKNSHP